MDQAAALAAVIGMVAECLDAEGFDEGITEESIAELVSLFELEIKLAAGANALPPPPPPTTTTAVGERRESCGPSLSVPTATVMASVDGRAVGAPLVLQPWPCTWCRWRPVPKPAAWWRPVPKPAAVEEEEDVVVDDEDEWVSQFLTDGPPVQGQHGAQ